MVWANGASYTGDWIFNQMEGKGDFRFPVLGVSYSGSFLKGKVRRISLSFPCFFLS
jgi:hypothetical protein